MDTSIKKIISFLLAALLMVALVPVRAFADEQTEVPSLQETEEVVEPRVQADQSPEAPQGLVENSWRYTNGELSVAEEDLSLNSRFSYPPWSLTPNGYINSAGSIIEGATRKGIDVSEHNGMIDWEAVLEDGIDFAIIRCGFGDDYVSQDDDFWLRNVRECERLGIPFGVYIYSYAASIEQASSEADHVLRLIKGKNLSYPVYYDLEEENVAKYGSSQLFADMARTFCEKIKNAGFRVGVYANLNWWDNYLTDPIFNSWERWVAQYNTHCWYKGSYRIWQSTSSGTVRGIQGRVDLNFEIGNYPLDVLPSDWYVQSGTFEYVVSENIMSGYGNSRFFGPYDHATRGQLVTIFWRRAGEPNVGSSSFGDVSPDAYYAKAIAWAVSVGLVSGYPDNTFAPDQPVSRQELAVFFHRYVLMKNPSLSKFDASSLEDYSDQSYVDWFARDSMAWCVDYGLISGVQADGETLLRPHDGSWRASVAEIVTRMDRSLT